MSKNERTVSIFGTFMTKFHELPEQPTYMAQQRHLNINISTLFEKLPLSKETIEP